MDWMQFDLSQPDDDVRAKARRELGRDAVLSVRQAAILLPLDDDRAAKWMREEGLVSKCDGKEVVIWGRVLDRIAGVDKEPIKLGGGKVYPRVKL